MMMMTTCRCFVLLRLLLLIDVPTPIHCFGVENNHRHHQHRMATTGSRDRTFFFFSTPTSNTEKDVAAIIDEDAPAGIAGAEFFGGNKQKAEFYDPVAEAQAEIEQQIDPEQLSTYDRFMNTEAFTDDLARTVAQDLQQQINEITTFGGGGSSDEITQQQQPSHLVSYANKENFQWQTSLPITTGNPLEELKNGVLFYRHIVMAITSASTIPSKSSSQDENESNIQLRFELSVLWPTIWEPRVMLTGTSLLKLIPNKYGTDNNNKFIIVSQIDTLDENWVDSIRRQILPRFWDLYHIGMTPVAELPPQQTIFSQRNILKSYDVMELPPRWYLETVIPSMDREDGDASYIPNPAFTCVIKTMGPMKQTFTPVSGIRIDIRPSSSSQSITDIRFQIPLAVEYAAQSPSWILPESGNYVFYPQIRRIATIPCGCDPQDPIQIPALRQKLYEAVIRDGKYKPKIDGTTGRPVFFYYNHVAKACYTHEGLGMAVYEWRPSFTQPNRIGLELEEDN